MTVNPHHWRDGADHARILAAAKEDHESVLELTRAVVEVDQTWSHTQPTLIEVTTRCPAFALPLASPLRSAMIEAAHAFGVDIEPKIAGPSNIGNYLAGLDIPVTAGFGVTYTGLHATDERFRIDTVPIVRVIYHAALLRLLTQ